MASDAAILRKHQLADIGSRIRGVQEDVEELKNAPDVVDIVATKAALDAYDTSKLTDKDVIRVLVDETHDGASTYYRWNATSSTWTYIGKTGDYYTKTETDALLNAKADKATTYTKTETDTLLGDKADKDTTYTKTETDTLLGSKEGKTITGAGAPTTSTEATNVGQQYYDTTNEKLYYCSAIDTTADPHTYTWEEMGGGGGIPTDATFWGQSYDAANNKVDGAITSTVAGPSGSNYDVMDYRPANGLNGFYFTIANYTYKNRMAYHFYPLFRNSTGESWATSGPIYISKTSLNLSGRGITGVTNPTSAQDAATKNYVDTAVASAGSAFTNAEFNNILENA